MNPHRDTLLATDALKTHVSELPMTWPTFRFSPSSLSRSRSFLVTRLSCFERHLFAACCSHTLAAYLSRFDGGVIFVFPRDSFSPFSISRPYISHTHVLSFTRLPLFPPFPQPAAPGATPAAAVPAAAVPPPTAAPQQPQTQQQQQPQQAQAQPPAPAPTMPCLLYTSDAADD